MTSPESHSRVLRDFYDSESRQYFQSRYEAPSADGDVWRARNQLALELAGTRLGTVLEVGAGPGVLTAEYRARATNVISTDFSLGMLEELKRRSPKGVTAVADFAALPVGDSTVDLVSAIGVWGFSNTPHACLSEAGRVLRPGGRLLLQVANTQCLGDRVARLRTPRHAGEPEYLERLEEQRVSPRSYSWSFVRDALAPLGLTPVAVRFYDYRLPGFSRISPGLDRASARLLLRLLSRRGVSTHLAEGLLVLAELRP